MARSVALTSNPTNLSKASSPLHYNCGFLGYVGFEQIHPSPSHIAATHHASGTIHPPLSTIATTHPAPAANHHTTHQHDLRGPDVLLTGKV